MYPMKAVCALPGQRAGVGGLDKTVRSFGVLFLVLVVEGL